MHWTCHLHDSYHIEITVDYPVNCHLRDPGRKWLSHYALDIFMLTPRSLSLKKSLFTKEDLVKRFKNIERLQAPQYDFCLSGHLPATSEYQALGAQILKKQALLSQAVAEAKSFGVFMHQEISNSNTFSRLQAAKKQLHEFRCNYAVPLRQQAAMMHTEVVEAFNHVDEYLSNRLQTAWTQLAEGQHLDAALINQELQQESGYFQAHFEPRYKDQHSHERHLNRLGDLKKYVSEALFLRTDNIRRESFYKNIFAAIAAAFAAIFANLARMDHHLGAAYGASNLRLYAFFSLAVIAYVFKDRIKDLSKEYLNTWFKSRLPDEIQSVRLANPALVGGRDKAQLGILRKSFSYHKLSQLPEDIRYVLRVLERRSAFVDNGAHVNQVHKELSFDTSILTTLQLEQLMVKDIFRISLSDLFAHLDDGARHINLASEAEVGSGGVRTLKVYHFDFLLKTQSHQGDEGVGASINLIRVVVNCEGILRLEYPLGQNQLDFYQEEFSQ